MRGNIAGEANTTRLLEPRDARTMSAYLPRMAEVLLSMHEGRAAPIPGLGLR